MAGVIDLTADSDDEEEVSPRKALRQFLELKPREQEPEAAESVNRFKPGHAGIHKSNSNDSAGTDSSAVLRRLDEGAKRVDAVQQRVEKSLEDIRSLLGPEKVPQKRLNTGVTKAKVPQQVQHAQNSLAASIDESQASRGPLTRPQVLGNAQAGSQDSGRTRKSEPTNENGPALSDSHVHARPSKRQRIEAPSTSSQAHANQAASLSNGAAADTTWNSAQWKHVAQSAVPHKTFNATSLKAPTIDDADLLVDTATLGAVLRELEAPVASSYTPPQQSVSAKVLPRWPRQFTADEDTLLIQLKEVKRLSWSDIAPHFPNRTSAALQVHYSSKLKNRRGGPNGKMPHEPPAGSRLSVRTNGAPVASSSKAGVQAPSESIPQSTLLVRRNGTPAPTLSKAAIQSQSVPPSKRNRGAGRPVTEGLISWQDARAKKKAAIPQPVPVDYAVVEQAEDHPPTNRRGGSRSTVGRILRRREMGLSAARASQRATRAPCDELRNHIFDSLGPSRCFKGTSADVNCLAWAPDGRRFAAGSIAITDERSMQYNRPCNLIYGDVEDNVLYELPEHHVLRPALDSNTNNVNALHSMRQTQDPRLFTTVGNVGFSPSGERLLSVGEDKNTRIYGVGTTSCAPRCLQTLDHSARVDLLSINKYGLVATAQHAAQDSIVLYKQQEAAEEYSSPAVYGPKQSTGLSLPIYPTTLKFGLAPQHQHLLLSGFASDAYDEDLTKLGESQLRDVGTGQLIDVATTYNVFDVAWNPVPSVASTVFAVASAPTMKARGTRSVVQCFAPDQARRTKRVLEWDCPALDINDVIYCQHDDSLIAAGATDGKVYVWDKRYASASQGPLHVFAHGDTLNVLDHDREFEEADTGVRFLAWGATSSRLYSGSSDGMVKVWNPHRATEDAHVKDVATLSSAVMSGAFSPDYRDLLIGEDQGQINLLSIDCEGKSVRSADRFTLRPAPAPEAPKLESSFNISRELLDSKQIELRPMGNLPVRQAVQGPTYNGPYFRPSPTQINKAEEQYQQALGVQIDVHSKAAVTGSQDIAAMNSLRDADNRVRDTQLAIERLESRRRDADTLDQHAAKTQARFRRQLSEETTRDASPCRLDCNYLPVDNDGEVPDSGRSFLRIPSNLRKLKSAYHEASSEESTEADRAVTCASCAPRVGRPSTSPSKLCGKCWLQRNGLTAVCSECSLPARPSDSGFGPSLCERCAFSCFKCSQPARVSPKTSCITCPACGLAWTADVLGYTLPRTGDTPKPDRSASHAVNEKHDDHDDFGSANIEYYHSQWQELGTEGWSTALKQAYEQY